MIPASQESIPLNSPVFTSISIISMTDAKCMPLLTEFSRFRDVICAYMVDSVANRTIRQVNNFIFNILALHIL